MLEGLRLARVRGYQRVEMECDNNLLVETILVSGAASSKMLELRPIHDMLTHP